jgi:predicted ATPase
VLLCPALSFSNKYEAALELIEQALATVNRNSERIFEAELYRLKARVLLARGAPDGSTEAQSLLDRALTTARSQHAKALELRTAMDLAALGIDQGRRAEALDLLAPIYAWFTEGFDTQDLRQAKALLDQLR